MKKLLPLVFIVLLFSAPLSAQEVSTFVSEYALGSTLLDSGADVKYDSEGNIILYGSFGEEIDFDLSANSTVVSPLGSPDLFLAKYSPSGDLIWVANFGRIALSSGVSNGALEIDSENNIVITGGFSSTINFNPLGESTSETSFGSSDAFIAKYDENGLLTWFKQVGGTSTDVATSLALNNDDSIAFGLRFSGDVDVDPGNGEDILTNAGAFDAAVVALDSAGDYLFSYHISTQDNDNVTALQFAEDSKLAVGSTINGATGGFPDRDMQLSFHQNDGSLIWEYNFSNFDDANEISSILFSQDELSLYIGGRINGTTDFNPDSEAEELIDPVFTDPFTAKYNLSGNLEWARFVSSSGTEDYFSGMAEAGSALITVGSFDVLATFVDGDFNTQKPSAGGQDIYIAAYDISTGDFIEADVYGGTGDEFSKLATFKDDGILACTGSYSGSLNLNPDGEPIDNVGFTDVFFAEFTYQTDLSDDLNQSVLEKLTLFPNPVIETVYFRVPEEISGNHLNYKMINVVGQVVKQGQFKTGISNRGIDVADLNKGVYILELNIGTNRVSKRIVKQ